MTTMSHCSSCDAKLVAADRFCPACGTPNAAARLHPRFGPAMQEEQPIVVEAEVCEPGSPSCPRCNAPLGSRDPYCRRCGMALDGYRRSERQADFQLITTAGPDGKLPYRPLGRIGAWLQLSLVADAVLAMAVIIVAVASVPHFDDAFNSVQLDGAATKWTTPLQYLMAACLVVTVGLFLAWFVRGYRNLEPLGVSGLRRSTNLAVVSWFVPLVNLVLPKEMMDDLWRASDPESLVHSDEWKKRSVPFRMHIWWICSLVAVVTLIATHWLVPSPGQISGSLGRTAAIMVLIAHPMLAVSSLLLLVQVRDVSGRQTRRAELLGPREESTRVDIGDVDDKADGEAVDLTLEPTSALRHSPSVSVSGRY